mmetsp:Transcript_54125/g.118019  ORF Transcript_54125/g.118019 Transcript_54125/m.118019 type:complete len:270 (+) Transcript_54125:70-879(+)
MMAARTGALLFSVLYAITCVHTTVASRVDVLRAASRISGRIVVSPSVAKADFYKLGSDLQAAVDGGAEWLHFSVQDGRMVPKISFGAPVISSLRPHFPDTVFDVKLGVIEPEHRVGDFIKAGADIISVHPEATLQLPAVLNKIDEGGLASGVVLNPGTPLASVEHVLDLVDVVVVMLVNPGYGGPKYMKAALNKIHSLREMCLSRGTTPWIEVDGGVSAKNAPELIKAGANALVAGGSVFSAEDKAAAIAELTGAGSEDHQREVSKILM